MSDRILRTIDVYIQQDGVDVNLVDVNDEPYISVIIDNFLQGPQGPPGESVELTFDDTPIEGSDNPVTSDGIYNALQDKVNVASEYTEGNIISFDENGNLADSGYSSYDFAFRVPTATQGHLAGLDGTGNLTDAGVSLRNLGDIDHSHHISETEILYGKKMVRVQPNQFAIEDSTDSDIYVFALNQLNIDGYNYLFAEYSNLSNDTVWVCLGNSLGGGEYVLSILVRQINPSTEMVPIFQTTRMAANQSYLFFQISHDYTQYFNIVYGVKDPQSMFAAVFDSSNTLASSIYGKEDASNKISTIVGNETDTTKYPNIKAVYDFIKAFADANNLTMP